MFDNLIHYALGAVGLTVAIIVLALAAAIYLRAGEQRRVYREARRLHRQAMKRERRLKRKQAAALKRAG
jgi:uncharacterized membrane protein